MTKMMPEFQSEMQFSSYLPVCSTTKDLPASGSSRPLFNNDKVQANGHSRTLHHNDQVQIAGYGYNNLYPPPNTSQLQDQQKEIIRKIMLEHEATFKHQVRELHRVYGRQRELMDEIRMKGLTTDNIEGKTSKTNPIIFGGVSELKQTCQVPNSSLVDFSCHWPSRTLTIEANSIFEDGKSMQAAPNSSIVASPTHGKSIMAEPHLEQSYAKMPNTVFQVQTKEIDRMQIGKDLEICSEDMYLKKMSRQHEHTSSNHLRSSSKPFDTHASLSKNATSSFGNYYLNNSIYQRRNLTDGPRYQIDLNSYPNEDGSSWVEVETRNAADINLEPPVSPQNKEASLPRGNSLEKQPTESVELTEKDDIHQKDPALVAAETLVLISSNSDQRLKWFAGIVTSAENHLEDNETVIELNDDGLNNFAALTPLMEETKLEKYCFNSTGNRKRTAPTTSSSQPRRKQTRRTMSQKAMQGDILPRITSPSRQVVSEETSTISWPRENEGKANLGKRISSKSERQKGKKCNSEPSLLQHWMCSYSKQQTADAEPDSLERCLPDWGWRNKRQRGQRRPASDLALRLAVLRLKG